MYRSKKLVILISSILLTLMVSSIASAQGEFTWSEEAGAFLGLSMVACAVGIIIWFVIWILVAIWVYRDAEKRGTSGALWLIIVIILGIIGIIIWLVVRPPIGGEKKKESDRRCPNCGRAIPMDARSCPYCNKKFES